MVNAGLHVSPTENVIIHGGHCNWEGATRLDLRQGDLNYFQPIPGKVPWLPTTLDPRGSSLATCRPQNGSWHFDPKMVEKTFWQLARWWQLKYFLEFSPRILGEDEPILTSIFFRWVVQPPTSLIFWATFLWFLSLATFFWKTKKWRKPLGTALILEGVHFFKKTIQIFLWLFFQQQETPGNLHMLRSNNFGQRCRSSWISRKQRCWRWGTSGGRDLWWNERTGFRRKIISGDAKNGKDYETNDLSIEIVRGGCPVLGSNLASFYFYACIREICIYIYIHKYHIPHIPRQCFMQTTGFSTSRFKTFFETKHFTRNILLSFLFLTKHNSQRNVKRTVPLIHVLEPTQKGNGRILSQNGCLPINLDTQ